MGKRGPVSNLTQKVTLGIRPLERGEGERGFEDGRVKQRNPPWKHRQAVARATSQGVLLTTENIVLGKENTLEKSKQHKVKQ